MLYLANKTYLTLAVNLAALLVCSCSPDTQQVKEVDGCVDFALTDDDAVVSPWPTEQAMPKNLAESLAALDEWLTEPQKRYFRCEDRETLLANVHFGLALLIRNSWDLDPTSPLGADLKSIGKGHPDDMSNFIALEFIHGLRGE